MLVVGQHTPVGQAFVAFTDHHAPRYHLQTVDSLANLPTAIAQDAWHALIYCQGTVKPNLLACRNALAKTVAANRPLPLIVVANAETPADPGKLRLEGASDLVFADRLDYFEWVLARQVALSGQAFSASSRATEGMVDSAGNRFEALAASLPGMVFHLQRDLTGNYRFLYASPASQRLLGVPPTELLDSAQRFFDLLLPEDQGALLVALEHSASNRLPLEWTGRLKGRRRTKWLDLRSTPIYSEGKGVSWQGIATNISAAKETEGALRASREQLAELSFHLEAAREQERERIARDIHDELGSILVRLKIEATLLTAKLPLEPPLFRDKARSIENLLDQAMAAASRVARELRPGILKEFGLPAAIESLTEDFSQHFGITCRVQCDSDLEPDAETSLALFRIVQEALTNVAKHAHASLVVVRLHRENGTIALEMRDNGRGISEADMRKPKSFGLRGIRERVHSLNGEFLIAPVDHGGGTHISLRVPGQRGNDLAPADEPEAQQHSLF